MLQGGTRSSPVKRGHIIQTSAFAHYLAFIYSVKGKFADASQLLVDHQLLTKRFFYDTDFVQFMKIS